jgi:hypothetical protein
MGFRKNSIEQTAFGRNNPNQNRKMIGISDWHLVMAYPN